jgi:pyruvate/2-oxoglutarate dehydrogenase complex dihydrolipoamide dehydrogenase (E3) component
MMKGQHDLVVIGAGSGGFAAARTAAALGKSVALIDHGPFGGLCILKGCMPSKTLIRSSEISYLAQHSEELGIQVIGISVDYRKIINRKNKIVAGFADYRFQEMKKNPKITFIDGSARFLSPHELQVGKRQVRGDKFLIATGSKVFVPEIPGLRESGFITSNEALELKELPRSLAIIGGGVIALELGQHFSRMGVEVHLFSRSRYVLSWEDEEVGRGLEKYLEEEGISFHTGAAYDSVSTGEDGLKALSWHSDGKPDNVEVEEILLAAGREADFDRLNLEIARVEYNDHGIVVNDEMETNVPSIFAAGDATGIYHLAHIAVYQGEIAGHNAFSDQKRKADYRIVPEVVFTNPLFARVGMNEKEARESGRAFIAASYAFDDLGKAICTGQTKGFVKMIADSKSGEILGVVILGAEADLLIHEMAVAMQFRATVQQFLQIPHFHPTLSEILTYPAEEIASKLF